MSDTFGAIWRQVRLHAPNVPFALIRSWTQSAYNDLHERRPWVFSMVEARLSTKASRSLAVTFTQGSKSITAAALFLAADVGRQIRVGPLPLYTIVEVTTPSAALLDIAYAAPSGPATAVILDAYVTMPAGFGAFLLVLDTTNQRQIGYWYTQADLALVDPGRTYSGFPQRGLAATTPSPVPATLGQSRYEFWPTPTQAAQWPYWYRSRPPDLADTDLLQGVLATRGDIIQTGALAECARWPGTADKPNPYFNMANYRSLKDDFEAECAKLELRDDDQSQQSWEAYPYHHWAVWGLGFDTASLRNHDATVLDYY